MCIRKDLILAKDHRRIVKFDLTLGIVHTPKYDLPP